MSIRTLIGNLVAAALLFAALPAQATSWRTFVSPNGNDANTASDCGLATPCRQFSAALSATTDGGEIVVLDSANYGWLAIDKSVTISTPPGVYAGISVFPAPSNPNSTGILIATANVKVALKGLTLVGMGGNHGVRMLNGAQLDLENCTFSGFNPGTVVSVETPALVAIKNSTVRNSQFGILVGYGATVTITNTTLTGIINEGIEILGGATGTTTVYATDTLVSCVTATGGYGFDNWASSGNTGRMFLTRVTATNCGSGIVNEPQAASAAQVIAVSNSMVTGNTWGMDNRAGNTLLSSGSNHVANNSTADVSGIITSGTMLH